MKFCSWMQMILKRYKESRRMHPIDGNGAIKDSILKERSILKEIRDKADYVIDTSSLLTRELKEELDRIFVRNEAYNSLMITIMSFGFKNGIPLDADLVFDVRFLPNPFYIDELKKKMTMSCLLRRQVFSWISSRICLHF